VAPVIIGRQGWRKSTFCRLLLPPELAFGFTDQLDFGNRRDIDLTISHYLLVNIDEFDQLTKHSQNGYLKNLLQRTDSKQRKLFTDSVNEKRRYASFIGTSNVSDLLTDPTGSRRFLCVELTAPIDTVTPIDYTQLYAQAVAELNQKLPYWFTEEEVKEIMASNRNFMQMDEQEVLFNEYFRAPMDDSEGVWLSPTEILAHLNKKYKGQLKMSLRQMGIYLRNTPNIPFRKLHSSNEYKVVLT
jgi:predicted P-loop ATPase